MAGEQQGLDVGDRELDQELAALLEVETFSPSPEFRAHASNAARLVLVAAALNLVWGWTKSFPVSIRSPSVRRW